MSLGRPMSLRYPRGKTWWSSTLLASMTSWVSGVPVWKSRGCSVSISAMVARKRPFWRTVTLLHAEASHSKLVTTGGSSPPVSHDRMAGVSRSASVAEELSYSPLKHAHQNHRLSFARRAPRSGPDALSTSARCGGERDQHRSVRQPFADENSAFNPQQLYGRRGVGTGVVPFASDVGGIEAQNYPVADTRLQAAAR